jgi:hypothetical protein
MRRVRAVRAAVTDAVVKIGEKCNGGSLPETTSSDGTGKVLDTRQGSLKVC